jgi:hypothetical protein
VPALYIPPTLRAPGILAGPPTMPRTAPDMPATSTMPHVALDMPSTPAPTAAATGDASPCWVYIPPALHTASMSPAGSLALASPPRGPLPGFTPLHLERVITQYYTCWPRSPPTMVAPSPAALPPLPKGAVTVTPVTNRHTMGTCSKSRFWMPAAFHAAPLSQVSKTFRSTLADPN